jgi:hypothetical protein
MRRPEHMESLPMSQSLMVVICPIKGWDLKTRKGASDFGCLKDK